MPLSQFLRKKMKIYYANIHMLKEEWQLQQALQLLTVQRAEKIEKLKIQADKLRSATAGLLLEYGLQKYGLKQRELSFIYGPDGKPRIKERDDIHFNLTHAKDYAAVGFSDRELGIDLESIRIGKQKMAERFFTKEENDFLQKNWSDELFTKFWTRKESYIKAVGLGMRLPLDSFSVLEDDMDTSEGKFSFKSFSDIPGYWLSVCRQGKTEEVFLEKIDITELL